jgi:hypothetical protein
LQVAHVERQRANLDASARRVISGRLVLVVDQPSAEQVSAIVAGDRRCRGGDADRRQARVGHAAHRCAADDPGDPHDGLGRGRVADAGHGEDRADADDRVGRRQQDEVRRCDRLEDTRRRGRVRRAYRRDLLRRDRGVQPDPPLLEVDDPGGRCGVSG